MVKMKRLIRAAGTTQNVRIELQTIQKNVRSYLIEKLMLTTTVIVLSIEEVLFIP